MLGVFLPPTFSKLVVYWSETIIREEKAALYFPFSHWFIIFSTVLKAFPGTGHNRVFVHLDEIKIWKL